MSMMSDNNWGDGEGSDPIAIKKLKHSNDEEDEFSLKPDAEEGTVQVDEEDEKSLPSPPVPVLFVYQYHVVKHIMEYLRLSDVLRAGLVNKQWSEIARIVRKQRKSRPFTMLTHPYRPHHKLAFEYFNGFQVSEEAKDLVESGKEGYHPYKRSSYPKQKFGQLLSDAKTLVKTSMMETFFEPQLIVNFGTSSFDSHLVDEHGCYSKRACKERMKLVMGEIQDSIPSITSFSCGVVASIPEFDNKTLEMEKDKFPCLSSLAIPKVAGLQTKLFTVTKEQVKELKSNGNVYSCKKLLGIDDNNEGQLKGIMFLHKINQRVASVVQAIFQYIRANPHVALAGGVHESVLVSGVADDSIVAGGILIFGNDLVRVSSIALQESRMSTNNTKKLDKLKTSVLPGGNNFAFMFACNGRGLRMHRRPNVESDMFNTLFPKVPMIGAFTFGEYCNETLSISHQDGEEEEKRPAPERIDFAYTTVFLLISYKHPEDDTQKKEKATSK